MLSLVRSENTRPVAISKTGEIVYLDSTDITKKKNELEVPFLQPLPNVKSQREIIYAAAPSGSGKSVMAKNLIKQYQIINPDNDVYIFSKVRDDPSLAGIKNPFYINIDESLVTNPINIMDDCENALILMDDTDTISDKLQSEQITQIMRDVLELGRHKNISMICTSHLILGQDRKKTRTIVNESHAVVLYPKSTSAYHIDYFLRMYVGCDKKTINKIINLPSRWVYIWKQYPPYVIHSQGAFVL